MTTTALELERPQFTRDQISSRGRLMLTEIDDINADAQDAICGRCATRLSWAQWINGHDYRMRSVCHSCGEPVRYINKYEWPMPVEHRDAVETPGYFNRRWYHATRRNSWAEAAGEAANGRLLVHAGSKLSALSRADNFFQETYNPRPVRLYSFELSSTAELSTTVYDDMGDDWPDRLGDQWDMRVCRTTEDDEDELSRWEHMEEGVLGAPYYNRYEVPGEISILFSAPLIDLSTVEVEALPWPSKDD